MRQMKKAQLPGYLTAEENLLMIYRQADECQSRGLVRLDKTNDRRERVQALKTEEENHVLN